MYTHSYIHVHTRMYNCTCTHTPYVYVHDVYTLMYMYIGTIIISQIKLITN